MKAVIKVAKAAFPGWNKRVHTEVDLLDYVEQRKILLVSGETDSLGEYTLFKNRPAIILDPFLKNGMRAFVFSHEIGHDILHHPFSQKFKHGSEYAFDLFIEKLDYQANFFATILLVPKSELRKSMQELIDEYGYTAEMLWLRKEYFERYKQ
jgi:Zn-dependent peptidase ImmA (M78 family)